MAKYIGVDVGGTNIACGIVDDNGTILYKDSIKTESGNGYETVIENIAALIQNVCKSAGVSLSEVERIGVGCPGCCNQNTGIVELCVNLGWRDVPLVRDLSELLKPCINNPPSITIENDANAAAYGEFVAGAAKDAESAAVITLGTGVGSGIILNGKLLHGMNFAAGELGHMVIVANGEPCGCGRNGCFEAYSSATGLIRMTKLAMSSHPDSQMHDVAEKAGKIGARTAWDAMRLGDVAGTAVVNDYISYLACGITNVINIFQPDIVCIGGGVCNERDYLLVPLKELVAKQVYSRDSAKENTEIAICELGNDAGIIGAALVR
jgi:glucokinase